jgi:predicted ATPase/DNA-binding SARP family transcriptional activator
MDRQRLANGLAYRLLGPLAVECDGTTLPVGTGKRPAVLALLLLSANKVVSTDRLAEELWHGRPPPTAPAALQNAISQLRRALQRDAIVTHPGGYELRVAPGALDVQRFESGVAQAGEAAEAGRHAEALDRLERALALWRGPALADFAFEPFARAEAERLEELRLGADELRFDCELALDRHAEVVAALQALVREHPLRERPRAQLMLALYRSGRQADALAVYRDARRVLIDELGLEPGPALRELEQAILEQRPVTAATPRLPAPPAPIVGRARELQEAAALLAGTRILTITGPGGTGKTRLALELAARAAGEAAFVDLTAVTVPDAVAPAIATALGLVDDQRLADHLRDRALLLVLDNLEQVDAAPTLGALIAAVPRLTILATSRHALRLAAEQEYPLGPLVLDDAVALFDARARAVNPRLEPDGPVAEVCRRLDGLPLAIELAAGWSKLLAPDALLERLERRLEITDRGGPDRPERQRTLRATIDWSHRLLDESEQRLFARLAVFSGGWTLDAAEAVCGEDTLPLLAALVDRSLVGPARDGRFTMLETIREYAGERLAESGEEQRLRAAHAGWALRLAEEGEPELIGSAQERWFERFEAEHANLRAALEWGLEHDPDLALRLAGALWRFWHHRAHLVEGSGWLRRALAAADGASAKALYGLAVLTYYEGDTAETERLWSDALAAYRVLGDAAGIAYTLNNLAMLAHYRGDHDTAQRLYESALADSRDAGEDRAIAVSLSNLGGLAKDQGRHGEARPLLEEALARFRAQGDERAAGDMLEGLAATALAEGDHDRAEALCEESLTVFRRLGDATGVIDGLQQLGTVLADRDEQRARGLFEDALARSRESGYAWGAAFALDALAARALQAGERERARALAAEALELHRRLEHEPGVQAALSTLRRADEVPV